MVGRVVIYFIDAELMSVDYKITLNGKNIFLNGKAGCYGFYVNVYTSSDCEKNAIDNAKKLINYRLNANQAVKKGFEDTVDFMVDEIEISSENMEGVEQGFAWYRDDN
jgi:hypothetical protein